MKAAAVPLAVACAFVGASAAPAAPAKRAQATPVYMDAGAPIANRVSDLLRRMTLEEKVGQMDQILLGRLRSTSDPGNGECNGGNDATLQESCLRRVLVDYEVGSILSGGTDNPPNNTGRGWAETYNTIQRFAIENSRLHIPILYGVDAVHGFGHPTDATLVPHQLGLGASWDPEVARMTGDMVRRQLMAVGTRWNFAPVQDLARDNRWGRFYEPWSEDKLLAGTMGAANIMGMQNMRGNRLDVAATVKHFAGYGNSINGHDRVQHELPIRYLQDVFLPSYEMAIKAGAASVMTTDTSINHVPAFASKFLQKTELRDRLGFKGVLITDYENIPQLVGAFRTASNLAEAAAQSINAGIDVSMTPSNYQGFTEGVLQAVRRGMISRARIDQAVRRILTLKFELGLFEDPYVDEDAADAAMSADRDRARQAAQESLVLLRNQNGTLPLSPNLGKVVVAGPAANNVSWQLGGWSVSWQGVFGSEQACCIGPPDQIPPAVTVLEGIQAAVGSSTQVVNPGTQADAVAQMADADVGVVVVGEKSYAEVLGDRPLPRLDPDQRALIQAMRDTGKPVVVVLVAGRPLGMAGEQADALLMAWQGGTETGAAVADVLFGTANPTGRLPVTWPSDSGDEWRTGFNPNGPTPAGDRPKFYDQLPGNYSGWGSGYNPTFPMGYGLSYTTFQMSGLSLPSVASRNGSLTARVTVANTGGRAGSEVVQVYAEQPTTNEIVIAPRRILVGFARVQLEAGQSKQVEVPIQLKALRRTPGDIQSFEPPSVRRGLYRFGVGNAASNFQGMTADVRLR